MTTDDPPSGARSATPGSPLRLYTAHFLLGGEDGEDGTATQQHQYLFEHPNGLFIVGLGACKWVELGRISLVV